MFVYDFQSMKDFVEVALMVTGSMLLMVKQTNSMFVMVKQTNSMLVMVKQTNSMLVMVKQTNGMLVMVKQTNSMLVMVKHTSSRNNREKKAQIIVVVETLVSTETIRQSFDK